MAKKDFTSLINNSQEQKRSVNLESENQRLREHIKNLEQRQLTLASEIKEIESSPSNNKNISIEEIKLYNNIRQVENLETLVNSIKEHGQLQPILLTSDNYLVTGHRRYYAVKSLGHTEILVSYLTKNLEEIKDIIEVLQFEENEQRQNLDNFDIGNLFRKYVEKGFSQKDLTTIFKKTKAHISALITIAKLDPYLVSLCKEFQIFAYSKKKFTVVNSLKPLEEESFYLKNKGHLLGWNMLYQIAKHEDIKEQKKAFLKLFKDRLSEEELNAEYFQDVLDKKNLEKKELTNALKHSKLLTGIIKKLETQTDSEEDKLVIEKLNKHLVKIKELLGELKL